VASISRLPLGGLSLGTWVFVEGKSVPGEPGVDVEYRSATPSYFETMNIPLRSGRLFDDHDAAASIVVINETMARRFWPGENPVGRRIRLGTDPNSQPWLTVVGVIGDIRHVGLDTEPRPELYRPYAVSPHFSPILVIRTASDPKPLVNSLAEAVRSVNPAMPAYNVYLMETLVDRSTTQRRFVMWLLTGFASAALLLAVVGIYGVISHSVVQRTQEIGLRIALGASPGVALGLVFGQGLRLTVAGIALGSLAAAGLTRLMRNLLFEVRPLDPVAFFAAAITLAAFALFACYLPARRATRVDPLVALRHD
jgi:predicted permease